MAYDYYKLATPDDATRPDCSPCRECGGDGYFDVSGPGTGYHADTVMIDGHRAVVCERCDGSGDEPDDDNAEASS